MTSSFRTTNGEVVHQAVLAGYGIGRLGEAMVVDDIRAARLYRLLPDYPSERRQGFIVYPSRRHLAPRTRLMIDLLIEQFGAIDKRLADERISGENETVWLV